MLTSLVFESHWQQLELVSALLQKGGKTLFWCRSQIVSIRVVVHILSWIRSWCASAREPICSTPLTNMHSLMHAHTYALIPHICHFFCTPLFRIKSVENANFSRQICKNLHRPKKIYTAAARGARDKYEVCTSIRVHIFTFLNRGYSYS